MEAPEKESEPESELDSLRRQALKVIEKKKRKSSNDEDIETVIEATTTEVIKDIDETEMEENNDDLKIETSTGNDIFIENLKRRRNKH